MGVEHIRNKREKDFETKQMIINKFKENVSFLPEVKGKAEEVSKYIAKVIDKDYKGLTTTQIMPLIAKRSIADIAVAGKISFTPEELSIAFNLYIEMLQKINQYTRFPPSKQTFCLFIGISSKTYDNYLEDSEKCEIMRIIDDYITSNKLTSAQLGETKEISTMFELKAQHGWVEAQAPVVVKYESHESMDEIKAKIASIKGKVIDAKFEEKEDR